MKQEVSVCSDVDSTYSKYAQYLSNAQSSIDDAIIRANSVRLDLPSISRCVSSMTTVKQQISQLITASQNAIEQITQCDKNNADRILSGGSNVVIGGLLGTTLGRGTVGLETFARVGLNNNAFGTSMEIMARNQLNLNPFNKAVLGSGYGTGDDILLNGSLIEVKAGEQAYASKVAQRVLNGDYSSVKEIRASKEMATYLDDLNVDKHVKIINTGISNSAAKSAQATISNFDEAKAGLSSTQRATIATDALQNLRVGTYMKAGAFGGVVGGGIEAVLGYSDFKNGHISGNQYASSIAKGTTSGVVSSIASTAAAAVLAAAASNVVVVGVVVCVVGVTVSAGVSWLWDKLFS